MNKIKVVILDHNLNGMPVFLARLTQRGHELKSMEDLLDLYNSCIDKQPSKNLLELPHTTIQRMCMINVAIFGLSTKAASQLRTHAARCTALTTSTQYSDFSEVEDPYTIPEGMDFKSYNRFKAALKCMHEEYKALCKDVSKDTASYLLPQGLRKCMIMHANFPNWQYILRTRLCNRNTREVQYICQLILQEINDKCGKVWADECLPSCHYGKCYEGKFCCGEIYKDIRS